MNHPSGRSQPGQSGGPTFTWGPGNRPRAGRRGEILRRAPSFTARCAAPAGARHRDLAGRAVFRHAGDRDRRTGTVGELVADHI